MKLFKLLKGIRCRVLGSVLIEIKGLYHNDKLVEKGGLFFCINGQNSNGEEFISSAVNRGAVAIVTERELKGYNNITQILVKNVRKTMSLISKNYYENPAKNLKLVAVTGTNGKTSTTYMIDSMLKSLGYSSAIIGTNGVFYNDKKIETGMTTPDPIELYKILRKLVDERIEYDCMEVSAHSIYLDKIEGLCFDVAIFSNLTEDHLDYFKTMDSYYKAKLKLFSRKYVKNAIINIDDEYGQKMLNCINMSVKTYSIYSDSNYKAENLGLKNFKQYIKIFNKKVESKFLGEFNIYNLLSAIVCLDVLKIKYTNLQKLIFGIKEIPGRFNTIVIKQKLFIIDYAHTPDGLENVLRVCKGLLNGKKLYCVFGCGGNRETQKRAKMGEISSKYADFTIITTDNPRFEDRMKIAKDIKQGVKNENYKIILDREKAIRFAESVADVGDIILVAGKGFENYIDENGVKNYYSDFDVIEKLKE